MVRNALFARVRLAALEHTRELGNLDENWGMTERAWEAALDDYFAEHNEIRIDGDARSAAYLAIDEGPEQDAHLWPCRAARSWAKARSRGPTARPGSTARRRGRAALATWWRRRATSRPTSAATASRSRRERCCATCPTPSACSCAPCPLVFHAVGLHGGHGGVPRLALLGPQHLGGVLQQLEQADLRAPHREAAGEADAPHAHHPPARPARPTIWWNSRERKRRILVPSNLVARP